MTDRALSVTVNYVMSIGIATILLSALIVSTGASIETRREEAIRSELDVVGERLAASIESADRLALAGGEEVDVAVQLPDRVAGKPYEITVDPGPGSSDLLLETGDPGVTVTVGFSNTTTVEPSTVRGGTVRVVLAADGDLEVREP